MEDCLQDYQYVEAFPSEYWLYYPNSRGNSKYFDGFVEPLVNSHLCGQRYFQKEVSPYSYDSVDRIVGGIDAENGEFPWIVSLQTRRKDGGYRHFCAGSVFDDYFILTAAHCAHK